MQEDTAVRGHHDRVHHEQVQITGGGAPGHGPDHLRGPEHPGLPGKAVVMAVAVGRRELGTVERQVWVVAASFATAVLGGLVLNLAGGLTRDTWLIWISGVICIGAVLSFVRLRDSPYVKERVDHETGGLQSIQRLHVTPRQGLLLLAALIVCVTALIFSIHSDATSTREAFVQSWILPQPVDTVSSTHVEVGIMNHLGTRSSFIIDVTEESESPMHFHVTLADGAVWTRRLTRTPGERMELSVANEHRPSVVIGRVYLASPVS